MIFPQAKTAKQATAAAQDSIVATSVLREKLRELEAEIERFQLSKLKRELESEAAGLAAEAPQSWRRSAARERARPKQRKLRKEPPAGRLRQSFEGWRGREAAKSPNACARSWPHCETNARRRRALSANLARLRDQMARASSLEAEKAELRHNGCRIWRRSVCSSRRLKGPPPARQFRRASTDGAFNRRLNSKPSGASAATSAAASCLLSTNVDGNGQQQQRAASAFSNRKQFVRFANASRDRERLMAPRSIQFSRWGGQSPCQRRRYGGVSRAFAWSGKTRLP
uniref:Uncharacterized protein n=1 Tax=Macrostomum lignano TaxID=282301 RepID=A0A1I8FCG3_9PLAT